MAAKKVCPSCKKEIGKKVIKCPECQKALEIPCWEIEQESGENRFYFGAEAEASIRADLISNKIKLSTRCRRYIKVLERVEGGNDQYGLKKEMAWRPLRHYADKVFSLQVLYNPVRAYGKRVALITWGAVAIIVGIGWNAGPFLAIGANPIIAIALSLLLLLSFPTIIGFFIASQVIGRIYTFPPVGLTLRTFFSMLIGGLVGGAIGWTLGYLIGALIGLTKKKVLEA